MFQLACQILVVVRNGNAFVAPDLATEEIHCRLGCEKGNEIGAGVSFACRPAQDGGHGVRLSLSRRLARH